MELILGSTSPRRREILRFFSIPFIQADPRFDEREVPFQGDPARFALETAHQKGVSLLDRFPDGTILSADTVVYRGNRLFLKPSNHEEAREMLRELAGNEHRVVTGVSVVKKEQSWSAFEESRVFLNELTDAQIAIYHKHFFPLDKAGGYAIQKGGSLIVKRIEGCYYNIMGLPIQTMELLLRKGGIDLWSYLKPLEPS